MIDKNDRLKVPKRLYIMDYQLEPCKIDGISDARLNAFPFNTTNGKLVEYLCLDTLWHPASEKPKLRVGKYLVVSNSGKIDIYNISFVYEMLSNHGKDDMSWKYWAYVSDLFPKEGGENERA